MQNELLFNDELRCVRDAVCIYYSLHINNPLKVTWAKGSVCPDSFMTTGATGDAVESVTFSLTLCMRFRTILLCVSINYSFAFLAYFVIDALRFHNTAHLEAS